MATMTVLEDVRIKIHEGIPHKIRIEITKWVGCGEGGLSIVLELSKEETQALSDALIWEVNHMAKE